MLVGIIVSILAILFALYDRKLETPRKFGGLEIGWLILFIYLAIRYDYGNDYLPYLNDFHLYNSYKFKLTDFESWSSLQSRGEYGWVVLNKLFGPIGFFGFIIVLTAFFMGQLYYLIKRYVDPKWYWLAVFVFVFHPTLMVVGVAGMIRQWTALFIFVWSFHFIRCHKFIPYILLILLASTIHTSAYFLLPVGFFAFVNPDNFHRKMLYWMIPFLALWLFGLSNLQSVFISSLFQSDELDVYSEFLGDSGINGFGISSILTIALPLLCFSQIDYCQTDMKYFISFIVITLLVIPFVSMNALAGRVSVYFSVYSIVVYPTVFKSLLNSNWKTLGIIFLLMIFIYYPYIFVTHFQDKVWIEHIYHYQTIFSQPWQ